MAKRDPPGGNFNMKTSSSFLIYSTSPSNHAEKSGSARELKSLTVSVTSKSVMFVFFPQRPADRRGSKKRTDGYFNIKHVLPSSTGWFSLRCA